MQCRCSFPFEATTQQPLIDGTYFFYFQLVFRCQISSFECSQAHPFKKMEIKVTLKHLQSLYS